MIQLNSHTVNVNKFANGESYADIKSNILNKDKNKIYMKFESDIDLMMLKYVVDFVHNDTVSSSSRVELICPYMPYSRMDRKENDRLFTLKSIADFINSLRIDSVEIWEPHSDVCTALLNNVKVKWVSKDLAFIAMMDILGLNGSSWRTRRCVEFDSLLNDDFTIDGLIRRAHEAGIWLVYPDAGAEKRYTHQTEYPWFISCSKFRDFDSGKIKEVKVNIPDNFTNKQYAIIIDDICSRGGTSMGTAEQLKKLGFNDIRLCITHCEDSIFTGDLLSCGLFTNVYTTDSILSNKSTTEYWSKANKVTNLNIYDNYRLDPSGVVI